MRPAVGSLRSHCRRWRHHTVVVVGLAAAVVVLAAPADSLSEPTALELEAGSVDGGGGASQSGELRLIGAVGQPDAGVHEAGGVVLVGGLWSAPRGDLVFSDDFESGTTGRWSSAVGITP